MTHGSLFSGIGGFDLGFERAGIETVWQVEIDEYCRRVLERHFPKAVQFDDIRTVCGVQRAHPCPGQMRHLTNVDIISGGFPCQPFSTAGRRKGAADNRYLWPEMLRVISELRPSIVVAENVGGFMSLENGRYYDEVHDGLEDAGYEPFPPLVIPACAVGANHIRNRVWIVAYAECGGGREHVPANQARQSLSPAIREEGAPGARSGGANLANPDSERRPDIQGGDAVTERPGDGTLSDSGWWDVEPEVGRVADGLSRRLDRPRLKALGNAVVPQIAQWIGERIMKAAAETTWGPFALNQGM